MHDGADPVRLTWDGVIAVTQGGTSYLLFWEKEKWGYFLMKHDCKEFYAK